MTTGFRASPQQRRVWQLRQAGAVPDRATVRCRADTWLPTGEIGRRLSVLSSKHEILRTQLARVDGYTEPLQVIAQEGEWRCREFDWRRHAPAELDGLVREHTTAGLYEAVAALLPDGTTLLVLSVPPEIADVRSLLLLASWLLSGDQSDDPLQYADLSAWLRDMLVSDETAEGRRHWDAVTSRRESSRLSFDRVDGFSLADMEQRTLQLPADLSGAVRALAADAGVSSDVVFLSAWTELLRRLGAGDEAVTAVGFDGLTSEDLAGALGPLERFLPVQTPPASATVREGLKRMQRELDDARIYQECHFGDAGPDRSPQPYGFQFCPVTDYGLSRIYIENLLFRPEPFRLLLRVFGDETVWATLQYSPDAFGSEAIQAIGQQWIGLLQAMVADRGAPLQVLPLATPEVKEQLERWGKGAEHPRGGTLLHYLENVVDRGHEQQLLTPEGSLRLSDLHLQANCIAAELAERGVGPGAMVGVLLPRSCRFVVACLGILKAGAAYVPLDPEAPPARLAQLLANAPLAAILTDEARAVDAMLLDQQVICVGPSGPIDTGAAPPAVAVSEQDPAYVLFTSGSTGVPKPVVIPHRAIVNHMLWMIEEFGFSASDRFLFRTNVSFDASVWEMLAPLMVGADMVIAGQEDNHDIAQLLDRMRDHRVTVAQFVPSLLSVLVGTNRLAECPDLRTVFCGGEALISGLVSAFKRASHAELVNLYGPTETCIDAAFWRTSATRESSIIPIGQPIHNTTLHVLDGHMRPVGLGITGELWIGGAGLFSGYLGDPDRTREVLVPNPSGDGFLYRTGDHVRLADDGLFEFVGRVDDQIKLNGFRIELGEIDAVIERSADVGMAATVVNDSRQLVGFVTGLTSDAQLNKLREDLAERLPPHMVPTAIHALERFPLKPNGKIDRAALRVLSAELAEPEQGATPEGELETKLASIWCQVLGLAEISTNAPFFSLGGDSIRAIQIVYEARMQGVEVTVKDVLRLQTIRAVARAASNGKPPTPWEGEAPGITTLPNTSRMDVVPAGLRSGVVDCYPASRMQRLFIEAYQADVGRRGVMHPQQGFVVTDPAFDPAAFIAAVCSTASATNFRTKFLQQAGDIYQIVLAQELVETVTRTVASSIDTAFAELVDVDRQRPFDAFDPSTPLLRVYVLSASQGHDHRVLISNHHAIQDGWGNVEFYNRVFQKLSIDHWENAISATNCSKELVAIEALEAGLRPQEFARLLGHPIIARTSEATSRPVLSRHHSVPGDLAKAALEWAGRVNVPSKALLLAAYSTALRRVFGVDGGAIGVVSNGRDVRLSEPLTAMGLFWYFAPFRMPLGSDAPIEYVRHTEATLQVAEEVARAFWTTPEAQRQGALLTGVTFNFIHFHNAGGGLARHGFRHLWASDDFGAALSLRVVLTPDAPEPLDLIFDHAPAEVSAEQVDQIGREMLGFLAAACQVAQTELA